MSWPTIGGTSSAPADLAPLLPFFTDLLAALPWWDRAWRVTRVETPAVREVAKGDSTAHPFGEVLTKLMALRGLSTMDLAIRCELAQATIRGVSSGGRNPHRELIARLARGLDLSEQDLLAIAGLDTSP